MVCNSRIQSFDTFSIDKKGFSGNLPCSGILKVAICKFTILSRELVIYCRGRKLKFSAQDRDLAYVFETNLQ